MTTNDTAPAVDSELALLEDTLRKTMETTSGVALDSALGELGWHDMLSEMPDVAIPLVFRLLGETGAHAPVINDVILAEAGAELGGTVPLPYAGGSWIVWHRTQRTTEVLDKELTVEVVDSGNPVPVAAGRRALGWWLVGTSRTMLDLARTTRSAAPSSASPSPDSRRYATSSPRPSWRSRVPKRRSSWRTTISVHCWPRPQQVRPR